MNATLTPNKLEIVGDLPKRSLIDEIVDENRIAGARYMPVMSPRQAQARMVAIEELKNLCLIDGVDYGKIPGTPKDAKPTLLKPGAEKICAYFGYVPHYTLLEGCIEDWAGSRFGEPLFYYHISCTLSREKVAVGEGSGSCSTWEKKYRYRSSKRTCPSCGAAALIKGKAEWDKGEYIKRGSWRCFEKKGGCNAQFFGDDPEIMNQPLGDVVNPDFADVINTVRKIADKRAYIASTLSATGASQWFSQDLEDQVSPEETEDVRPKQSEPPPQQAPPTPEADAWRKSFIAEVLKANEKMGEAEVKQVISSMGYDSLDKITTYEAAQEVVRAIGRRWRTMKAAPVAPPPAAADPLEITDADLPANIAAGSSASLAGGDQVLLADLRQRIGAFRKPLGARYDEILAQFGLKSLFGFKDDMQAEEVLTEMKKAQAER